MTTKPHTVKLFLKGHRTFNYIAHKTGVPFQKECFLLNMNINQMIEQKLPLKQQCPLSRCRAKAVLLDPNFAHCSIDCDLWTSPYGAQHGLHPSKLYAVLICSFKLAEINCDITKVIKK